MTDKKTLSIPAMHEPVLFTPRELGQGFASFPYELHTFSHAEEPVQIFHLRHDAYLNEGWIGPTHDGLHTDATDACPQTVQLGAFHGDVCKCAVRMTIKGWTDPVGILPCAAFYPAIQAAGLRKLSIAELSHIVVDPAIQTPAHKAVLYSAMVRAGLLAVQAARIAMLVAAARPDWRDFYAKALRFHAVGAPARYPPAAVDLTLMGGNMVGAGRREVERNPFFQTMPHEIESMRKALIRCLGSSSHKEVLTHTMDRTGT